MALLFRGEELTSANPKLDLFTYDNDVLTTVGELRCRIFDISTTNRRTKFYNPAVTLLELEELQIFPATPGEYSELDVIHSYADIPIQGHKLGVGHYYVPWSVPEGASPGSYVIIWEFRFPDDSPGVYKRSQLEFVISQAHFYKPEENVANDVREYMQDYTYNNELVDGLEYTDAQIQRAVKMTVMRLNGLPPFIGDNTMDSVPSSLQYAVIRGTTGHLLQSTSLIQLRNQLTYTDGGIHVGLTDKHQLYQQAGGVLLQEFDDMATKAKIAININGAWGQQPSPMGGDYYNFYSGS